MKIETNNLRAKDLPASTIGKLLPKYEPVIEAMCYGLDEETLLQDGTQVPPGYALTLRQAALHFGFRLKQARLLAETTQFATAIYNATKARRHLESPRNLQVAIDIRDDEGDNSAATKKTRLAAIDTIEGKSTTGTHVQVNVNQQASITAGYVIRLPTNLQENEPQTSQQPDKTINHLPDK